MEISTNYNHPAFSAKFVDNSAFRDVLKYAEKTKQLPVLDNALYKLKSANRGNIIIIHGRQEDALVPFFSSFTIYKEGIPGFRERSSVQNMINKATSPEETSFNAILELAELGRKFRKLFNAEPKNYTTSDDIIEKYTVSKYA